MHIQQQFDELLVVNITEHYRTIFDELMSIVNHQPIAQSKVTKYITAAISVSLIRDWGICSHTPHGVGLTSDDFRIVIKLSMFCSCVGLDLVKLLQLRDFDNFTDIVVERPGTLVLGWR